jgi:aerobic carbon-monoxide dehydrogenase medium subunit
MYPAPIESYSAPASLNEVLRLMHGNKGDTVCIAGGMSLMQAVKARIVKPRHVVDLNNVAELSGVQVSKDGVRIGAMTRYCDIAGEKQLHGAYQALCDAAAHVGDRQVRNRGTVGGSLCWNYLAACTPPTCLALGAQLELARANGKGAQTRSIAVDDFLKSPLETARADDEVLVAIKLPVAPHNAGSAYRKWGLVTDALPVIGVAVYLQLDANGACSAARVGVGGLATGPRRAKKTEQALVGCRAANADKIMQAFATGGKELELQSDMWADTQYRQVLLADLGSQVTASAFARAKGGK